MMSLRLKKTVALALMLCAISASAPAAVSAAWKKDSKGWWNTEGNSYSIGWRLIDGKWYHFDSTGYMSTGWINDKGTWYYTDNSGVMQIGWVNDNGTWYYTNNSGAMQTGWVNDNGTWYYTNNSGAMQT
ncbi:MAG: N-acetylmuramoyl-L-alanine amidase family protein, partial [Clostridium sp.]